jgi:hypothetical protein
MIILDKENLYWSVYKNLEKEILELSYQIHICDNQLNVYSIKIADLLFRISAEIESLIKDLFRLEKSCEPKNPGEALITINDMWCLDKKLVMISATSMYFKENKNKIFAPFLYEDKDENDYYSAYNAVKHDRVKNLHKATVRVLLRSMAALFLLNIYYKDNDEKFELEKDKLGYHSELGFQSSRYFDNARGSNIYSIKTAFVPFPSTKPINNERACFSGLNYCDSTYLQIVDKSVCNREWKRVADNTGIIFHEIENIAKEKGIITTEETYKGKLLFQVAKEIGDENLEKRAMRETYPILSDITPVMVLNKAQAIYWEGV